MIIIISGLQGVGKTTIINELLKIRSDYKLSVSATTREKRQTEHLNEYEFMTVEDFNKKTLEDYFLETIEFNGNKYGTPKHQLDKNIILNVNPSSILNFYDLLKDYKHISIFIDGPEEIIKNRLIERDKGENVDSKISKWQEEIIYKEYFHHIIENLHIHRAISNILKLM